MQRKALLDVQRLFNHIGAFQPKPLYDSITFIPRPVIIPSHFTKGLCQNIQLKWCQAVSKSFRNWLLTGHCQVMSLAGHNQQIPHFMAFCTWVQCPSHRMFTWDWAVKSKPSLLFQPSEDFQLLDSKIVKILTALDSFSFCCPVLQPFLNNCNKLRKMMFPLAIKPLSSLVQPVGFWLLLLLF